MPKVKLPEGEGAVKPCGEVPQILRYLRPKHHRFVTDRMLEGEALGVQPQATAGDGLSVERVGVHRISDG